jgi:hypothetical protein
MAYLRFVKFKGVAEKATPLFILVEVTGIEPVAC